MTPFSERGSAVLLEDIAAVEVTVLIEVVVERGMDGGKFLQGVPPINSVHRRNPWILDHCQSMRTTRTDGLHRLTLVRNPRIAQQTELMGGTGGPG